MDPKPAQRSLDASYIEIDLPTIADDFETFPGFSNAVFSKPFDRVWWQVTNNEHSHHDVGGIEQIKIAFQIFGNEKAILRIKLYVGRVTNNIRLELIPEEYVALSIDMFRKKVKFESSVVGEQRAKLAYNMLMGGIKLMSVDLPEEHQYLSRYLEKFFEDHPDYEKNVFLIMRFRDEKPFPKIINLVKDTCSAYGLNVIRADERAYTDDLWANVLTYMYGCKRAIAIFDQINYDEFNPNVSLEIGFMFAQCKEVLLLKDVAIKALPTDVVGKIYRPFNTYDPEKDIPPQLVKWFNDIRVPPIS